MAGLIFPTAPRSVDPGYYLTSYPGTGTFVLLPSSLALTNLCLFSDFLVQNAILYLFSFHSLVCSKLRDCSGKYEPPLTSVIVQLFNKFRTFNFQMPDIQFMNLIIQWIFSSNSGFRIFTHPY